MIQKPYSKQKWRFFDLGLFIHIAQRVAPDVKEVEYFTPWVSAFSKPHQTRIGDGVPGLTRVQYFFEDLDSVDVFVFPDVGFGDIQDDLRRRGKAVFGMGQYAEKMEVDRFWFREQLKARGLDVAPYKTADGITDLYAKLEKDPDVYFKLNNDSRGIEETFYIGSLEKRLSKITKISSKLDCFREEQQIMLEKPSHPEDGIEMGDERFFTDGEYLPLAQYGCEIKGCGYAGIYLPSHMLPRPVAMVSEATKPILKKSGAAGVRSTEIRFGKKQTAGKLMGFFMDACMRNGRPPSGTVNEGIENITEVISKVARGEQVTPIPKKLSNGKPAKHCAEIIVCCPAANDEAIPFTIKDKDFSRVKVGQFYKNSKDGLYYRIPLGDGSLMAECVGFGESLEEAEQQATESVELIDFDGKEYDKDIWEQMDEKLEKADKLGVGLESGKK